MRYEDFAYTISNEVKVIQQIKAEIKSLQPTLGVRTIEENSFPILDSDIFRRAELLKILSEKYNRLGQIIEQYAEQWPDVLNAFSKDVIEVDFQSFSMAHTNPMMAHKMLYQNKRDRETRKVFLRNLDGSLDDVTYVLKQILLKAQNRWIEEEILKPEPEVDRELMI